MINELAERVKRERKGKIGESGQSESPESLIHVHLIPFHAELVREK